MSIAAVVDDLREALETVDGVRVYTDPGAVLDPPAIVIGPPRLDWETGSPEPTTARLLVIVAVTADDRALPRLWALVPQVAAAIEDVVDAVVLSASPGSWMAGGADLPCYEITTEVSL